MTSHYGNEVPAEAPISRPLPGAHLADPAPLGLAAFALTTFLLSVVNAGWMDSANEGYVLGLALAYGGLGQFAAGMWEFAKGNTFGALAFSSYGAFWISFWWLVEHDAAKLADADKAVGWYLFAWGIFTLYMTVAATRVSGAVLAVFVLLTLTFFVLAWGKWATSDSITHIGGYIGLLTAIAAWYTSFAGVTAFTFKRQLLPVAPRT
ncbi:acetate uptake transporter [Nocardioides sp. CER19]|uniref:acetate uptake transporter n=1 Tax=Nocardioides sp. CER19 TaxID=3038538 RepID=UPI0024470CA9|nr:acetate uptake transporter [Nocardioides sp. CER19]MDH2412595.1 acetate uptake transporter [Nocardioides sp. CER19]